MTPEALLLAALFFAAALLYSSVGHAGASAYLAAMALVGVAAGTLRPTALVLNLFVASIVVVRFARAGHLPWRDLVPLAAGSIPMAFIGGSIHLPGEVYRPLVALVLLAGAWRLATVTPTEDGAEHPGVPLAAGAAAGAGIGLLAGLTGTGGGIFLTPLLVLAAWTGTRAAAGLSGAFILVNSLAGLGGLLTGEVSLPPAIPLWIAAVV
ncbi:MAG TPA: TSUP family transporter, partial [Candidatus Limnocylindria bacterium]